MEAYDEHDNMNIFIIFYAGVTSVGLNIIYQV